MHNEARCEMRLGAYVHIGARLYFERKLVLAKEKARLFAKLKRNEERTLPLPLFRLSDA